MESARLTQLIFHVETAGKGETWFYRSLVDPFVENRVSSSSIFLSHESLIERLSTVEVSSICRQIRNHLRWNRREYWSNSIRVIYREMKRVQVRCTRVDGGRGGSVCRYESRSKPLPRGIVTFFFTSRIHLERDVSNILFQVIGIALRFHEWIIDRVTCRYYFRSREINNGENSIVGRME